MGGICHAYFGFWFMFMFSGFYFAISHGSCLVMWFPYPHGILPSVCVMRCVACLFEQLNSNNAHKSVVL